MCMRKNMHRESVELYENRSKGGFLVRITCPKRRKTCACISENANTHRKRGAVIKYAFTTCYCENNDQKCAYVQEKPSSCEKNVPE